MSNDEEVKLWEEMKLRILFDHKSIKDHATEVYKEMLQSGLSPYCYTIAKEAWEILQIAHEGTSKVKSSKLQMLTTEFENLRMTDDEAFKDFYARLCDISNQAHSLGEKYSESKLVRKVLRSLPNRFHSKVTAIEESKDIDEIKIEELVGSLMTYELNLGTRRKEKATCIAFRVEEEKMNAMIVIQLLILH
ncbi:Uncharacterized protein Adt_20444 [Abeliophyllum distichum]|uniref:Gag-pol polyprotein n=1 Tax=Abeliophyllum distichum TaxID=126358 RepID=A0ABD1SWL8_9LAMI